MGESNLDKLIQSMQPVLNEGEYVFTSIPTNSQSSTSMQGELITQIDQSHVIGIFTEVEGKTYIISKSYADSIDGLNYNQDFIASWITLNIHSSLNAVGFTAAISTALTKANICCNVVAGYFHDHLFVSVRDAPKAMEVLTKLAKGQD